MEKFLDVLRPLFPFVRNPYAPHSFLRLDAFQKQFTIVCVGEMKLPISGPGAGYRQVKAEYIVGYRSSIDEAIRLCCSKFYDLYAHPQIDAGAFFEAHRVEIYYTAAKAYRPSTQAMGLGVACLLHGVVEESEIIWHRPAEVMHELSEIELWLHMFQRKITDESCISESDIANIVYQEAQQLKRFFELLKWRNHVLKALNDTDVLCTPEQHSHYSGGL